MKPVTLAGVLAPALSLALAVTAAAQVPASSAPTGDAAQPLVLDPFTVNTQADRGYRPGNSVSATRIQTPIRDLPMAVNVFTEEFIRDLATNDFSDILRYAPNVTNSSNDFTNGDMRYSIRGFAQFTARRNGFGGQRLSSAANLARVEVVKGPASVLYGAAAPGGIINYITKAPQDKAAYSLKATVGSFDLRRFEADATGPLKLLNQKLAYRVVVSHEEAERQAEPSGRRRLTIAPSFRWDLTPQARLTVEYDYFKSIERPPVFTLPNATVYGYNLPNRSRPGVASTLDFGDAAGVVPHLGAPGAASFAFPRETFNYVSENDSREGKSHYINASLRLKLPAEFNLQAYTSYSTQHNEYFLRGIGFFQTFPKLNADGTPQRLADGTIDTELGKLVQLANGSYSVIRQSAAIPAGATLLDPSIAALNRRVRSEKFTGNDTDVQVDLTRRFDWSWANWRALAGMRYNQDYNTFVDRRLPAARWGRPWDLTDPSTWDRSNTFTLADLTDVIASSPGETIRHSVYSINQFYLLRDRLRFLAGASFNSLKPRGGLKVEQTSPQFGVNFQVTPAVVAYASYSESFTANTGTKRVLDVPAGPFDPTIGEGFDVGFKFELLDGRISSAISYYDLRNTGIVRTVFQPDGVTGNLLRTDVQSGEERSQGFELDATITFARGWKAYLSYGYMDAYVSANADRPWLIGTPLENATRHTGGLLTKYEFSNGVLRGLHIGGGVTYVGDKVQRLGLNSLYPTSVRPDGSIDVGPVNGPASIYVFPAHALADVFAGYRWRSGKLRYAIDVSVKNVADKYHQPSNLSRGDGRRFSTSFSLSF